MRTMFFHLALMAGVLGLFTSEVAVASEGVIDKIEGARRGAPAFTILREGKVVEGNLRSSLQLGDLVELKDSNATIMIRLAAGKQVSLYNGSHKGNRFMVTDDAALPATDRFLAFAKRIFPKRGKSSALAASKGASARPGARCSNLDTNNPEIFDIPVLYSPTSMLGAGTRTLFVSWQGGLAPFTVTLLDKATGQKIAERSGDRACEVAFESINLLPGNYVLILVDSKNVTLRGEPIVVVPANAVPVMPEDLQKEVMPEELRAQYYANWLAGLEDGRWALEAVQFATPWAEISADLRSWLNQWGGGQ